MPMIRALAIHVPVDKWDYEKLMEDVIKTIDRVLSNVKIFKIDPWTFRIILPLIPSNISCTFVKYLMNDLSSVFVHDAPLVGISFEYDHDCIKDIVKYLEEFKNLYIATRCDNDICIDRIVNNIYNVKITNIDIFTKFAVLFGYWVETPYFPATSNVSNVLGISISLRYVDLMSDMILNNRVNELFNYIITVNRNVQEFSKYINIPFLGFDLSLSPWKNESVCLLIERLILNKFGYPGTLNAIYSLNILLKSLPKKIGIKTLGFNEVMLPVAEDDLLNERVREGDIRLRDLINYGLVCVAGLDMVAIPRDININRILIDMLTIFKRKNSSVAMRIIPTDLEAGNRIYLDRFGETFVINP